MNCSRWRILDFRLLPHAGKDTFIITGFEEILQQLEESQVSRNRSSSLRFSPFDLDHNGNDQILSIHHSYSTISR